jgi:hypothetical protein
MHLDLPLHGQPMPRRAHESRGRPQGVFIVRFMSESPLLLKSRPLRRDRVRRRGQEGCLAWHVTRKWPEVLHAPTEIIAAIGRLEGLQVSIFECG